MFNQDCWPALLRSAIIEKEGTDPYLDDKIEHSSTEPDTCETLATGMVDAFDNLTRIFSTKPLDAEICGSVFWIFIADDNSRLWWRNQRVAISGKPDTGLLLSCGELMEVSTDNIVSPEQIANGHPERIQNCVGVSYESGVNREIYYYTDRFPDGEEYWGYRYIQ